VFFIRIATVIGPTPPGTGVISDARSRADSNYVADELAVGQPVHADVDYDGAGRIHSPGISPGLPTGRPGSPRARRARAESFVKR
jgi:hypothetical protein